MVKSGWCSPNKQSASSTRSTWRQARPSCRPTSPAARPQPHVRSSYRVARPAVGRRRADATFYGGAGIGGACTQSFVYPGFRTVAMNAPQYAGGAACGGCLHACYVANKRKTCFNAVVDNECPECTYGALDLGWNGGGRWPVTWNWIQCPKAPVLVRTQGSNNWYAKVKFEGVGRVNKVSCMGKSWQRTMDGFWVCNGAGFACGFQCTIWLDFNRVISHFVPGNLFGGGCSRG